MKALLILVGACAIDAVPVNAPNVAPPVVTIVDAAGRAVAGARIDWQQGGAWSCDVTSHSHQAYIRVGRGVTDGNGQFVSEVRWITLRAVAPNGDSVLAHVTRDATLVVKPTATIAITPRCETGACGPVSAYGKIVAGDLECPISESTTTGQLALPTALHGNLTLELRTGDGQADERALVLHVAVDGNLTLTPTLPEVAGAETLRGRILLDGKPPGGLDYASNVRVRCGELVSRPGKLDVTTGAFTVEHLPARDCVLRAESDARALRWERELTVRPGDDVTVELQPQHL